MPWREISVMDQKEEFVLKTLAEDIPFAMLCREYGIVRKTAYKWKRRFLNEGRSGLIDRSRSPDSSPSALSEETIIRIIRIRSSHPSWGAKKIARIIEGNTQSQDTPSVASVYRILDKANLLKRKRSYKGWWMSEDIKRCNPLTIRDLKSRYTLAVRLTPKQDTQSVADTLEHVFSEYGLPRVIRSDNGPSLPHRTVPWVSIDLE
jgi:putative transposase